MRISLEEKALFKGPLSKNQRTVSLCRVSITPLYQIHRSIFSQNENSGDRYGVVKGRKHHCPHQYSSPPSLSRSQSWLQVLFLLFTLNLSMFNLLFSLFEFVSWENFGCWLVRVCDEKEKKWKCTDIEIQRHVVKSISAFLDCFSRATANNRLIKVCFHL